MASFKEFITTWQVPVVTALIAWGAWVTIGVSQIDNLATKVDLLETKSATVKEVRADLQILKEDLKQLIMKERD